MSQVQILPTPIKMPKKRYAKGALIMIRQWYGRLGNNLMQLSNALYICEQYQCKLSYPEHPFLKQQDFDFSWEEQKAYYISLFYYFADCRGVYPDLANRRRIMQKYVRPLLNMDLTATENEVNPDRLVLQIRSGDIFNKPPNPRHLPSPLAYFTKIMKSYAGREKLIVCQNFRNPCIQKLQEQFPECKIQSSDLVSDFRTLMNATNLVVTPGTFGFIAAMLSTKIKRLYTDDLSSGVLDFGFFNDKENDLDFKVIAYRINDYIPYGKWINDQRQYQLVLNLAEHKVVPVKKNLDANTLAKYFLDHWREFGGEGGHVKLLKGLKQFFKVSPSEENKTVLAMDVGANVGHYLMRHLRHLCKNEGTRFLVFEPNPINLPPLQEKINLFSKMDIQLYPVCVSDINGQSELMTWDKEPENKPGNELAGLRAGGKKICDVEVLRLDAVLSEIKEDFIIKILKIDTEGNDPQVIKGLGKYIEKVKYIIFEASDSLDDHRGLGIPNPLRNIVIYLDQNGFDTYRPGIKKMIRINGTFWHPAYEEKKFWSNCFAIKKGDPLIFQLIDEHFDYNY